jgi:IstB-like ATP binding protein
LLEEAIQVRIVPSRSQGRTLESPPARLPKIRTRHHDHHQQQSFTEWGQVLGDDVLATAILDRLLHHCDVININGPSYRLKDRVTLVAGGEPMT